MTLSEILSARPETQAEFAAKVGVAQTTVGFWRRGKALPPSTRIPFLAAALGMPEEELRALVAAERETRQRGDLAAVTPAAGSPVTAATGPTATEG